MSKRTYALDFETYYDKKVSITELGPYHYLHHPFGGRLRNFASFGQFCTKIALKLRLSVFWYCVP